MNTLKSAQRLAEIMAQAGLNQALIERATELLRKVDYLNYEFHVCAAHGGVLLHATYMDADTYTGAPELQYTRPWRLTPEMTDSEIVQTAFKCCLTSAEHRCREAFTYRGARIFGPHFDVEDLVKLCQDGREAAGGRSFTP